MQEFEYWDFPGEAAVREAPPSFISDNEKSRFEQLIRAGAAKSAVSGQELIAVIGLDMGTSSTKLIVRLPYEPGETTIAIPAPRLFRSDQTPYLWRTMLWLKEDGAFCPWPEPGAAVLNSLKQGLIQERSETVISSIPASLTVNRAQAGVAYLSFVIRYAKGWLARNRPNLFRGRKPVWLVNLGMPAASYDDLTLAQPYRRIGAAALKLASSDSPVTAEATQIFLDDPRIVEAGASSRFAEGLGIVVIPETAAAMTGFAKSIRSAPDLYFMVDVGAMTLDACMFRLNQNMQTGDLYAFMAAQIRPLGVESFHWFLSEGKTESEFVQQCERTLRIVIWSTKCHRDRYAENWKPGSEVPVFLVGGGASNQLHKEIVNSLDPWLKKHAHNDGIRLLTLEVPDQIELPEPLEHFGRMAVAWGLSFPSSEIGEVEPMSKIDDMPPPTVKDFDKLYISKDVT